MIISTQKNADFIWQYVVCLGDIGGEQQFDIQPEPKLLTALAKALKIVELRRLQASLTLIKFRNNSVKLHGHVLGDVVQNCVLTLEPVEQHVYETVCQTFISNPQLFKRMTEREEIPGSILDMQDEEEPPEFAENGQVDLAAIALEHFALGIELYPKCENAKFSYRADRQRGGSLAAGRRGAHPAFEVLAKLKNDDKA